MKMQRHIFVFFMFIALQLQSSHGKSEDGILYIVLLLIITSFKLTICSESFDCLC